MDDKMIDAYLKKAEEVLIEATTFLDPETKVRRVRDADFWGVPVNTIIKPGMKPQGGVSGRQVQQAIQASTRSNTPRSVTPKPIRRVRRQMRDVASVEATPKDKGKRGKITNVRDVEVGDWVTSRDASTKQPGKVVRKGKNKAGEYVVVDFGYNGMMRMFPDRDDLAHYNSGRRTQRDGIPSRKPEPRKGGLSKDELDDAKTKINILNRAGMKDYLTRASDDQLFELLKETDSAAKNYNDDADDYRMVGRLLTISGMIEKEMDGRGLDRYSKARTTFGKPKMKWDNLAPEYKDDMRALVEAGTHEWAEDPVYDDVEALVEVGGMKAIAVIYEDGTVDLDYEFKANPRYVRDVEYWGKPYGTLITPGMKPVGSGPKG